ncbi:MAG: biotin--[acetyl-CoA-carboxylase] ligase [Verrucomicrobiota bacterium]|nr:biotin--[acetyl-CoA-carboxylase] ligase [Verrucomicrobiota bacterium]
MWRLDSFLDDLNAENLRAALRDPYIGNRIVVVQETTSTNDLVWQMAQEKVADGLVAFAERQTAGRGQRGNRWESEPHHGLWFSILLRPKIGPAESARLSTWAAQTVATTVQEQLRIKARVKPPNDVYVKERKIAGVLVEMRVEKDGAYLAIAGIGVNVNQNIEDFSEELRTSAGSLAIATGQRVDRREFAVALLRNLDRSYRELFVL